MPMNLLHYRILYYPFLGRNTVYPLTHQLHYHPILLIDYLPMKLIQVSYPLYYRFVRSLHR